jgi:hypothetical protein
MEMPSHPIARRLEVLAAQWTNFTSNPEARLLRAYREAIRKHMEKLLGPAWREAAAP